MQNLEARTHPQWNDGGVRKLPRKNNSYKNRMKFNNESPVELDSNNFNKVNHKGEKDSGKDARGDIKSSIRHNTGHKVQQRKNIGKREKGPQLYRKHVNKTTRDEDEAKVLEIQYNIIDVKNIAKFKDFPLSAATQNALEDAGYIEPTQVQRESILLALRGFDVLGSAKTGSGKTLAFVIPLLERLWRLKWSREDGLGALIITPTRELAYQIFETIRKVGKNHDFSAGLVIGGKDWNFEGKRLSTCNVIVCTPGRLLQHMDENPQFDPSSLNLLVLDEADRCLDMGFSQTMNAILENLPTRSESGGTEGRQTLLFSATQTRSVKDLARLSLVNPIYISVHERSAVPTPEKLSQSYIVCELSDKINMLWSFLKSHRRKKILVFMQSCKQVKYVNELFSRLRHGAALSALYGTLHQLRRMAIYDEFCKKEQGVLFATDIAARGLDFPAVDWVIQLDCPEDATTYLHRVGRTARHASVGNSLLILIPSEESGMLQQLRAHKIPVDKIEVNPKKMSNIQRKIEAYLAQDYELKESASRAFVAYLKSTYLLKNKVVFDVFALDTAAFASSLGLAVPPRVRFLQRQVKLKSLRDEEKQHTGETETTIKDFNNSSEDTGSARKDRKDSARETEDNLQSRDNPEKKISCQINTVLEDSSDDESGDILKIKRRNHEIPETDGIDDNIIIHENEDNENMKNKRIVTKVGAAKKALKKGIKPNQVVKFDQEGDAIENVYSQKISQEGMEYDEQEAENGDPKECGINIEEAARVLRAEDRYDQQIQREKAKMRKKQEKRKSKAARREKLQLSEGGDENAGDQMSEEGSTGDLDLDWLPDPDVIYGKETNDDDNNIDKGLNKNTNIKFQPCKLSMELQNEESDDAISLKRKWKPPKKNPKPQPSISSQEEVDKPSKKRSRNDNPTRQKHDVNYDNDDSHGELLDNDEELALQLLRR